MTNQILKLIAPREGVKIVAGGKRACERRPRSDRLAVGALAVAPDRLEYPKDPASGLLI